MDKGREERMSLVSHNLDLTTNSFQFSFLGQDDVNVLKRRGISVDDDNNTEPDNVPCPSDKQGLGGEVLQWGHSMIDPRRIKMGQKTSPRLQGHAESIILSSLTPFQVWMLLFPVEWLKDVVIPMTNEHLGRELTLRELICFIGVLSFMACYQGVSDRRWWWSRSEVDMKEGAPYRLNQFMSLNRFEEILANLRLTDLPPPPYVDPFHEVRQCITSWNDNMSLVFVPSWMSCLDESMMVWYTKFAPGFMVVPRKPHPFGNEFHSICCCSCMIMYMVEMVEGKDRPKELGKPKHEVEYGWVTECLMVRMT